MTKAVIFTRSTIGDHDQQRDEIIAKFGDTHEIVAEYRSDGTTASLPKLLEESGAEVLLCTGLTRLGRQITPGIMKALQASGVKIVSVSKGLIDVTDLVAEAMKGHSARTESQQRSARIKQGIQAARQRRRAVGG